MPSWSLHSPPIEIHFLHGNLGSPQDWQPVLRGLSHYPVKPVAWHLWDSMEPFETWAGHSLAKMPQQGSILVGYSLGARLALHLLNAAPPGHFRSAILISPHPGLTGSAERESRLLADQAWGQRCLNLPWEEFWAAWNAQAVFAQSTVSQTQIPPEPPSRIREAMAAGFDQWSLGRQADFRELLARPGLFSANMAWWLTGAADPKFSTLADTLAFHDTWRKLQLPSGHRIPHEIPESLAHLIAQAAGYP